MTFKTATTTELQTLSNNGKTVPNTNTKITTGRGV